MSLFSPWWEEDEGLTVGACSQAHATARSFVANHREPHPPVSGERAAQPSIGLAAACPTREHGRFPPAVGAQRAIQGTFDVGVALTHACSPPLSVLCLVVRMSKEKNKSHGAQLHVLLFHSMHVVQFSLHAGMQCVSENCHRAFWFWIKPNRKHLVGPMHAIHPRSLMHAGKI